MSPKNGDDCVEPLGDTPKNRHWHQLAVAVIVIGVAATVVFIVAQLWPYNNASSEHTSGVISEEETSDGIPVVREGGEVVYETRFCNSNVSAITTVRWMDIYGTVFSNSEVPIWDIQDASGSRFQSEAVFNVENQKGCFDDIRVEVPLGLEIPTGTYYRLRTVNSYKPNFLATAIYETETDLFYLAEIGEELP